MAYDEELPGCFGSADLILAGHPDDEQRAFAWLIKLRKCGAVWPEVKAQIEEYLLQMGADRDHIEEQLDRADELFRPWLWGPDDDDE
jgi:hypothetical protein